MQIKLNFEPAKSDLKMNLDQSIYMMGSCFSDEIGSKLNADKFDVLSNPFGTIYNPISLFRLLGNNEEPDNIIQSSEAFYHWGTHGSISGLSENEVINEFKKKQEESNEFLSKCDWLVITLGTAWVYRYKATGDVVANCHKVPSSEFNKELLDVDNVLNSFDQFNAKLNSFNPELKILFTVSPVRHIRDGLIENNQSKAVLIESIRQIISAFPSIQYFPSYEIMIDELRDYRFYSKDLIHPSDEAIEYIWQRFKCSYMENDTLSVLEKWDKLRSALNHKPFQPHSNSHQKFLKETLKSLNELNDTIDLRVEIERLKAQLV